MDRKKRLWWSDRLSLVILAAMLAAAFFACMGSALGLGALFVLLILALVVEFTMNRCPHCNGWLSKNRGQFCQHCGQRIRRPRSDA